MWGKEKLFLSDCENHRRSTSNVDSCSKNGRTNDDEKVTLQVQNHAVGNIAGIRDQLHHGTVSNPHQGKPRSFLV